MRITTCKNCEDRQLGCHGSCKKYLDARAEYDKQQAAISDARNKEWAFESVQIRGKLKAIKRKGRK